MGPLDHTLRRRKRTYSFSGSERDSTTGTPTPSDIEENVNILGGGNAPTLLMNESHQSLNTSDSKGMFHIIGNIAMNLVPSKY